MPKLQQTQRLIVWCVVIACASFLLLMCLVCMVRDPALFKHPHWGLSFYGDQKPVLLPYYGGFAIVIGCLARITQLTWNTAGRWQPLRLILLTITILTAGIMVTSSMQGNFLYWSHISICLALALVLLPAEVWIVRQPGRNWLDWLGLTGIITATVLLNLSANWIGVLGIYYWAEVVFFLAAFLALGRAAVRSITSEFSA